MPGQLAANAHEGSRSEYLALYAFSALGTAVHAPHQEDSGVDLYATLGQRMGRLLAVEHYFLVQVKSTKDAIRFDSPEKVRWLLSHQYPFLLCVVDKSTTQIEVFQTLELTGLATKHGIQSITLSFENPPVASPQFQARSNDQQQTLFVGAPILRFGINETGAAQWRQSASQVLESWVALDQENILSRAAGFPLYRHPESYQTNTPIEAKSFTGNFKDVSASDEQRVAFFNALMRQLSQLVNMAAGAGHKDVVAASGAFAALMSQRYQVPETWGAKLFHFCFQMAAKHLGLPALQATKVPRGGTAR